MTWDAVGHPGRVELALSAAEQILRLRAKSIQASGVKVRLAQDGGWKRCRVILQETQSRVRMIW